MNIQNPILQGSNGVDGITDFGANTYAVNFFEKILACQIFATDAADE